MLLHKRLFCRFWWFCCRRLFLWWLRNLRRFVICVVGSTCLYISTKNCTFCGRKQGFHVKEILFGICAYMFNNADGGTVGIWICMYILTLAGWNCRSLLTTDQRSTVSRRRKWRGWRRAGGRHRTDSWRLSCHENWCVFRVRGICRIWKRLDKCLMKNDFPNRLGDLWVENIQNMMCSFINIHLFNICIRFCR